ncbi:MAG: hypothetical protein F6K41_05255 [Symploca sp. SIO3E6]|nr:hypothetical protein [Caldora sp. SIO3E6]
MYEIEPGGIYRLNEPIPELGNKILVEGQDLINLIGSPRFDNIFLAKQGKDGQWTPLVLKSYSTLEDVTEASPPLEKAEKTISKAVPKPEP